MSTSAHNPLRAIRKEVAWLILPGVVLAGIGALATLLPFVAIAEFGRVLLRPGPPDVGHITTISAVIAGGLTLGWFATGTALWLTHLADHRLQTRLRRALVARLGAVPLGWYSDKTSGAVRKAVQDDLDDLHHLVAHHDVELVSALVLPVGGLAYLAWLDWRLMLLAIATLPVYLMAYAWMMRGFSSRMAQLDASFSRVSAAIVEFVHGISVVKAFGQTGRAHRSYQHAVRDFGEQYAGWVRPMLKVEAITSMALSAPVILLVSLAGGVALVGQGRVDAVDVLAEALVALVIPQTLLALNHGLTAQRKALAAAGRIEVLLSTPSLPVSVSPRQPAGSGVNFEHVSFAYDGSHEVLSDVSLVCQPGTVTALVGSSGAGKSTLAKLVPRFHDVTGGRVTIGGADVRDIAPHVLYRQVGFVLQDVQLVHGTVRDNIRLGRPDASEADVIAAARLAQVHQRLCALPRGYDSVVGDDAVLSGGEAQRVSIARTLLADAPVLVLDEATAHADPESEAQIQDALSAAARGRTVIVIAHRLASIVGADQIVVLDKGRIVEQGTHETLLARGGPYARLWHPAGGSPETHPEPVMEALA